MVHAQFDAAVRALGHGTSRRGVLGLLAGLISLGVGEAVAKRQVAAQDAPCAHFCVAARDECYRDFCSSVDPNTIAFRCEPQGVGRSGTCETACACGTVENQPGPADAQFCQEVRRACQTECRDGGLKGSVRCQPIDHSASCACA